MASVEPSRVRSAHSARVSMHLLLMRGPPHSPQPGLWQTEERTFELIRLRLRSKTWLFVGPAADQKPWAFQFLLDHGLSVPLPGVRGGAHVFFPTRRAALAMLTAAYEAEERRWHTSSSALDDRLG